MNKDAVVDDRLLSGPVRIPSGDDPAQWKQEALRLRRKVEDLELEVQKAQNEARRVKRALTNLRDSPLGQVLRVLKIIFGELEGIDLPDSAPQSPGASPSNNRGKWEIIASKLGNPHQAGVIRSLADCGEMTGQQLAAAVGTSYSTVTRALKQLHQKQFIRSSGGKYNLRED